MSTTATTPAARLLLEAFDALGRGDLEAASSMLSEDFVVNHVGQPVQRGRDAWAAGVRAMLEAVPDLQVQVLDLVAEGGTVAVRVRLSGTHRGPFFGAPASARSVAWSSFEFYRVEGGLLAEEWICPDITTMASELGLGPGPA